jgi:hypothetical protein
VARNEDIIICECHSTEHQIIFKYDDDVDKSWDMVYVDIHLNSWSFWKRLKYGIKYIFGYKCRYGAFDEIIIKPEDADKIQRVVDFLNKVKKNREPKTKHISELFNRNKEE